MKHTKPIYDIEYVNGLRERNAIRLKEAKDQLGTKWLLHPANQKQKQRLKYHESTLTRS